MENILEVEENATITREEFLTQTALIFNGHLLELEELIKQLPKPVHYHDRGLYTYIDEVYILVNRIRYMAEYRIKK